MSRKKMVIITISVLLLICWCFAIISRAKKVRVFQKLVPAPPPPIKHIKEIPRIEIIKEDNIEENIIDTINSYPEGRTRNEVAKEIDNELEEYIGKLTEELSNTESPYAKESPKAKLLEDLKRTREYLPKK